MEKTKTFSLHPAQAAIWNSPARFKICAAGRRFGKSYLAGVILGTEALKDVNERGYKLTAEHPVYYVAPTFDQAKRIMWRRLRLMLGYEKQGGFIAGENVNDGYFELVNGRRIYIKGADNADSLRGEGYAHVVLDEYADMAASVWEEILDPALMDVEGGATFIGTPKGKNHFYKLFMKALEGREGWEAFHFKSADNPFINAKEIARIKNDPNKSLDTIRQELDASFVSGGSKVLVPEWFRPIVGDPVRYAAQIPGSTYVTVDLAGFKKQTGNKILRSDESVVAITHANEDKWTILDIQSGHWDPRETALFIVTALRHYPGARLGIESGALSNAVGPYLEEYMRTYSRFITPEPLTHGNQRKTDRISWALQGRGQRGLISILKADWNDKFLAQVSDFPDPLSHDDMIDAVAYVDQMAQANFIASQDIEEWEPLDLDAGY